MSPIITDSRPKVTRSSRYVYIIGQTFSLDILADNDKTTEEIIKSTLNDAVAKRKRLHVTMKRCKSALAALAEQNGI